MSFELKILETDYVLSQIFMLQCQPEILYVSYQDNKNKIEIQVVILDGSRLENDIIERCKKDLPENEFEFTTVVLTKEEYNQTTNTDVVYENEYFKRKKYSIFSKSEVL